MFTVKECEVPTAHVAAAGAASERVCYVRNFPLCESAAPLNLRPFTLILFWWIFGSKPSEKKVQASERRRTQWQAVRPLFLLIANHFSEVTVSVKQNALRFIFVSRRCAAQLFSIAVSFVGFGKDFLFQNRYRELAISKINITSAGCSFAHFFKSVYFYHIAVFVCRQERERSRYSWKESLLAPVSYAVRTGNGITRTVARTRQDVLWKFEVGTTNRVEA